MSKPVGILVLGEKLENGELAPVVFELVSQAKRLSQKLENCSVSVVVAGENADIEKYKAQLSVYGVSELVWLKNPLLNDYNTSHYAQAILQYLSEFPKEVFLVGATRLGRDLAPCISSALNTGLTADCTGLEINDDGKLAATRPTFGGELMATILSKTYPQMATVRPNVFKSERVIQCDVNVSVFECPNIIQSSKKIVSRHLIELDENSIENAKIILAGGKGLKTKENFEKLYKLADKLGAKSEVMVGATRKAVESGLAPQTAQVGQTGKTVSPDLYIAFGISGAIQHAVGIGGAKKIIAVNNDTNAPIIKIADKTIVADAVSVIDEWLNNV